MIPQVIDREGDKGCGGFPLLAMENMLSDRSHGKNPKGLYLETGPSSLKLTNK